MRYYTIITDSSCDLPAAMAAELELEVLPLSVLIDGRSYVNHLDERDITFKDCYAALRAGKSATTSAVNVEAFVQAMEPHLQAGRDILYLGFSSALSGTYNAGAVAARQLSEKYPDRRLYAVDTLSASMGQGLLVYLTVQQKRAGATIEGEDAPLPGARITKADLYAAGLTGGADSRAARQRLLEQLDLPEHLSTNALLEVLNALMTREAFRNLCK